MTLPTYAHLFADLDEEDHRSPDELIAEAWSQVRSEMTAG